MHDEYASTAHRVAPVRPGTPAGNRNAAYQPGHRPPREGGFAHLLAEAERVQDRVELTPPPAAGLGWRLHSAVQGAAAFVQRQLQPDRARGTGGLRRSR